MRDEEHVRSKLRQLEERKTACKTTLDRHPNDTETLIVYNVIIAKIEALQWVLGERRSRFFA